MSSNTSAKSSNIKLRVNSPNVVYSDEEIFSNYDYLTTETDIDQQTGTINITPISRRYQFKTNTKVPKLGFVSKNVQARKNKNFTN